MGKRLQSHHSGVRLFFFVALLLLLVAYTGDRTALAHGKELTIEVSSFTPDPGQPLNRLYRVRVVYASDRDPVSGAKVWLTAVRQGSGPPMEALQLEPLNEPGLYAAEVNFPLYGSWEVTLRVAEEGVGETSYVEEVLPTGPARDTDEVRQEVLQIFFSFNWKDVAAIAVRVAHSLATVVWFSLSGAVLVAHWFLPPVARPPIFRRLARVFAPGAGLSLGLVLASGVYTGIYSAPVKAPGVFDFDVMWRIPFGGLYLATIGYKVLALAACGVLAVFMVRALRAASYPIVAGGDDDAAIGSGVVAAAIKSAALGDDRRLYHLAAVNAVIGVSIAFAVVLAVYLHYISHLAVFLPA